MRILVVEDDAGIAGGLAASLRQAGYAVDVCGTLSAAWSALSVEPFDAVLLDWACPTARAWTCWRAFAPAGSAARAPRRCRTRTCRC